MLIDSVKAFIKTCPFLKNGRINANFLGEKAASYTIDNVPAAPVIKKYTDGSTMRQFLFVFASREFYGQEEMENMNVSAFYEQFAAWLEEKSRKKELPKLSEGFTPLGVEALSGGYLFDEGATCARYQIQCRLVYLQKGGF